MVHITSVYDGTKYLYMMYKDGNSISIDMLNSHETTERNGLEVKVQIGGAGASYYDTRSDTLEFIEAIKSQLVYFENLYIKFSHSVINSNIEEEYNTFSTKKYKNFLLSFSSVYFH